MNVRPVIVWTLVVLCVLLVLVWYMVQKSVKCFYQPESYTLTPLRECTIVTYNIQKFPWLFKSFDPIVAMVRQHSIVMLQECFDDTFDALTSIFPDYFIFRGTLQGVNAMNSGLAVLSKFPILEGEFVMFDTFNALSFDAFSEKGFLSVVIDVHGKRVRLVDTHLQSCDFDRFDPNAMTQLDELLRYLKIHNNEKYFIVGGDFNIDIADLLTHYDIQPECLNYPTEPTIFINFTTSHSKCTKKLGYDGLVFDYFLCSRDVKMTRPQVIVSEYSDHNAVESVIEFR